MLWVLVPLGIGLVLIGGWVLVVCCCAARNPDVFAGARSWSEKEVD